MKVILLKEVKGRGGEGDVIEIKDGFANNYLLKEGLAVKATKGALKQLDERRKNIEKREEVRIAEAKELHEKLDGLKFNVDVQIGDEGQLFGAVTSQMIADAIKKLTDVEIDKRRIDIRKAIKTVGLHNAEVSIYRDIKANLLVVVGDEDVEKFLENLKNKKNKKFGNKSQKKNDKKQTEEKTKQEEASDKQNSEESTNVEEPKQEEAKEEVKEENKTEEQKLEATSEE